MRVFVLLMFDKEGPSAGEMHIHKVCASLEVVEREKKSFATFCQREVEDFHWSVVERPVTE